MAKTWRGVVIAAWLWSAAAANGQSCPDTCPGPQVCSCDPLALPSHSDEFELEVGLDYIVDQHPACRGHRVNVNVYWRNRDGLDNDGWDVYLPTVVIHHGGTVGDETIRDPDFRRAAPFFDQLSCNLATHTACGPNTPACTCINDECECWQLFSYTQIQTRADDPATVPVDFTFVRKEVGQPDQTTTIPISVTVLQDCRCGGSPC